MFTVYILKSQKVDGKSYVGFTVKPVKARLDEYNSGLSRYTKAFMLWKLVYYESFYCKLCAEKREKFLKSGVGYRLRKMIVEQFEKYSA